MNKIILIGGPPRSGKTTLAQKVSSELNIPWISTDAFDDIAKGYVSEADRDILFPKSALRRKSGGGNDKMYSTFQTSEIVEAYLKQAETIHSAIKSFVDCANTEGWDYVIEGYHITPKLISTLSVENQNILSIMLVSTNGDEVIDRSKESNTKQDWLRDNTKNQETFGKVSKMVTLFSNKINEEAKEFNVKVIDTSENFAVRSEEALNHLIK